MGRGFLRAIKGFGVLAINGKAVFLGWKQIAIGACSFVPIDQNIVPLMAPSKPIDGKQKMSDLFVRQNKPDAAKLR